MELAKSGREGGPIPAVEVACVVCGSDRQRTVCSAREVEVQHRYLLRFHKRRLLRMRESAKEDRIDFTQDYATDIVACESCGLIFRNPRPTKQDVIAAYAAERYDQKHLTTVFKTHLDLACHKAGIVARWLPHREKIKIVEVGSFVGSFLAAGRERGWDMLGIDPGEQAVAFSKAKGLPVQQGTITDLKLPSQSVDCVAIWNTFDQLPNPRPTLQTIREILRPDGLVAIRIPNGACFASAMAWDQLLPRWASGWFRMALAWNNLLMFPYLVGYSVSTADRLLSRYDLRRIAAQPDTLVSLADPNLKWWAGFEEQMVKLVCRTVAQGEALLKAPRYVTAPWLDLYYRKIA